MGVSTTSPSTPMAVPMPSITPMAVPMGPHTVPSARRCVEELQGRRDQPALR
jgi:hypothetical protein